MIDIFLTVSLIVGSITFLIFTISPLLPKSRDFIREGLGKTQNYLVEIMNDIQSGERKWVIGVKYSLHVVLSAIMSAFIGIIWPFIAIAFLTSVLTYIFQKYQR
jgi:hypothetical protein